MQRGGGEQPAGAAEAHRNPAASVPVDQRCVVRPARSPKAMKPNEFIPKANEYSCGESP